MKFLRLAFYVLIAQLILSGCAGEAVEETSSSSSSEINFDAYLGRNASTRSEVTDNTHLKGTEGNSGFGVFARYKHTDGTISPLMLMNNEHVTWNKNQKHWEYTNTRYWPNEGISPHQIYRRHIRRKIYTSWISFVFIRTFQYWDCTMRRKGIEIHRSKDRTKTNEPVKFTFNHALARLGFDITANQDLEENGAVITVNKVILYGASEISGVFVMAGYLNLENGAWTLADNDISWFYTWTPDGKVDGKENVNENDGTVLKLSAPPQLDHEHDKITNADDSYIFIIPQEKPKNFNLKITYTVTQGNFKEDVTVTKNLLDVLPGDSNPYFKGGKAYVFHLKLSLDPINFNVTTKVEDWKEGKNE